MKVTRGASELLAILAQGAEGHIGFVPTMGALHEGHLSLVRAAKERCLVVIVSIFVNPLQFAPGEDLARYPRDEAGDLSLLEREGVDVVFLPSVEEMYPAGRSTTVSVGELATVVEGASRPGHFEGVATVVAKLFNVVRPTHAFFGQKDAQQLAVIRRMTADLGFPIEIVACPTVREGDGLAMSSRNAYLKGADRSKALALWRSLQEGRRAAASDSDAEVIEKIMWETLASTEGVDPDYARVVDPDTFLHPHSLSDALLVVAARVGGTRLIDNMWAVKGD